MEGRGEILILSSNNYLGPLRRAKRGRGRHRRPADATARDRQRALHLRHLRHPPDAGGARSPDSSAPKRRCRSCRHGMPTRDSPPRSSARATSSLSDALNHASIIDSIRLAKAITKCTTAVYRHGDMDDLVAKLEAARGARRKMIWTDGIFSMEGSIAKLPDDPRDRSPVRRDRRRRRLARDRRARRDGPRDGGTLRRRWARSTSSRRHWARLWAAPSAGSSPDPLRSATC